MFKKNKKKKWKPEKRMSRAFSHSSAFPRLRLLLLLIVVSCFSSYLECLNASFIVFCSPFHISLYIFGNWQRAIGAEVASLRQTAQKMAARLLVPSLFSVAFDILLFSFFAFAAVVVSFENVASASRTPPTKKRSTTCRFLFRESSFHFAPFSCCLFLHNLYSPTTIFLLVFFALSFAIDEIMISHPISARLRMTDDVGSINFSNQFTYIVTFNLRRKCLPC